MEKEKLSENKTEVSAKEMVALEEELYQLKKEHGIEDKKWWHKFGDFYVDYKNKHPPKPVLKKKYIWLTVLTGWMGGHRFYVGHKILGVIYLLLFWTGIPFTMAIIDLMIVIPKTPDENGFILI